MSAIETTPNSSRFATQSQNSRTHSVRTATTSALDDQLPPARPVFLESALFINALAGPSRQPPALGVKNANGATSVPMQTTRVDGRSLGSAALPPGVGKDSKAGAAPPTRKRTVADAIDRENLHVAPVAGDERANKRLRANAGDMTMLAAASVTADAITAKRKQRKIDRGAGIEKLQQDTQQWRQKYRKAFPSFTFYFDAIDEATQLTLGVAVKRLGASVDNFFSKKVTHVVTTRPIPTASTSAVTGAGKENVESGSAGKASTSAAGRARKPTARSPKIYELPNGHRVRHPEGPLDQNPFIDSQDILAKAVDFGLKIWSCDKLQLIVDRINQVSPHKDKKGLQRDPSLPTLLRDEQLYGTRERDPVVPRNDMYYFPPNKMYLFVEDSTGEHRPIVIKEYDKPKRHEDPTWPILWGGVEGRTGFYHYDGPEITYERRVPPPAPAPVPAAGGATGYGSTAARAVAPNLRRAVSLQNVTRHQQAQYAQQGGAAAHAGVGRGEYLAASGNSQIITSNIASATSTAARSGAAQANRNGANPFVDKRLAVLSNRNVSVSGGMFAGSATSASASGAASAAGSGGVTSATAAVATLSASEGRSRVAALKRTARPTAGLKRSISVDAGLNPPRTAAPPAPPREEVKKPGYCENCRIKYDDFTTHVVSSKHRRFALNPKNWFDLDALLEKIERPVYCIELEEEPVRSPISLHESELDQDERRGSSEGSELECDDSGYHETSVAVGHVVKEMEGMLAEASAMLSDDGDDDEL